MMVKDAVKVLVDVVEHVDHFHGRAVVAQCGEAHDVTEVDGDLLKQLWLYFARLLQGTHHRAVGRGTCESYLSGPNRVHFRGETSISIFLYTAEKFPVRTGRVRLEHSQDFNLYVN